MRILDKIINEDYNTAVGTEVVNTGETGSFGDLHSVVKPIQSRETNDEKDDEDKIKDK